jgi:hypothetical protein
MPDGPVRSVEFGGQIASWCFDFGFSTAAIFSWNLMIDCHVAIGRTKFKQTLKLRVLR